MIQTTEQIMPFFVQVHLSYKCL